MIEMENDRLIEMEDDRLIVDPDLKNSICFNFTCDGKATGHDPIIFDSADFVFYVPVCSYHKRTPQKGRIGFLTLHEAKYFGWFVRIVRWLAKRKEKKR